MKRIIQLFLFTLFAFSADAQRIKLLQFERYLGDSTGSNGTFKKDGLYYRQGYVGLTDTLGDQYYKKLDSIIVSISDSLIGLIPSDDTDHQYFDTNVIDNDTLVQSLIRDGRPAHRLSLKAYVNTGDHDWYEVGTTDPPNNNSDFMYNTGKVTIGDNASYTEALAVPLSNIRVQEIIIGYPPDGESTSIRIGKNNQLSNNLGYFNVSIGSGALQNNVNGESNMAIGTEALYANYNGIKNTAVGVNSLKNNQGNFNTGIGYLSLYGNILGNDNIGLGYATLQNNVNGSANVAIGNSALFADTSIYNVAIGVEALRNVVGGFLNTAIGFRTGYNATGSYNVFIGQQAGYNETGDNKLYIESGASATPLIYGDFANDTVRVHGSFQVTNRLGTATALSGWRGNDGKAVETGLGTGLSISSGVLNYTPLIDQFQIIDDTLYISETGDGVPPFFR